MPEPKTFFVHTPVFPLYSEVRSLMKILQNEVSKSDLLKFMSAVWDQTGTPQNPVDWSDPDQWIEERLTAKNKQIAQLIWTGSNKAINPRHVYGSYLFINGFRLLIPDSSDLLRITEKGAKFLNEDSVAVREIDEAEGMPKLLSILAAHSPAKRGDLLSEWGEFLLNNSKYGTKSTISDTLRRRILNLIERGYIIRTTPPPESPGLFLADHFLDYGGCGLQCEGHDFGWVHDHHLLSLIG